MAKTFSLHNLRRRVRGNLQMCLPNCSHRALREIMALFDMQDCQYKEWQEYHAKNAEEVSAVLEQLLNPNTCYTIYKALMAKKGAKDE